MRKFSPENERIKHRYFGFLTDAKRLASDTVDQVAAALSDFEASTGSKDFRLFRVEQAQSYKAKLGKTINPKTKRPLAKATISSRLAALKAFFQWLAQQPGFRSRLVYSDAEYFNPSAKDERVAKATRERPIPSVEQIRHVLATMPGGSDTERRDRAVVAFTLVSGARDNATASLSLKHIDLENRRINQDARDVRTKNAKTINSSFFPVGTDIEAIVADWINFLKDERLWGPDDPLFPATKIALDEVGYFQNRGLDRRHWKDAEPIRGIFRQAFERAGLPYSNPHSIRNTLALLSLTECKTLEALKAWSQNLGHSRLMTTLMSYGTVATHRQHEILADMRGGAAEPGSELSAETIQRVIAHLTKQAARTRGVDADSDA